ncbi:hypothetical protein EYF80_066689 [Liparis tanakae]|uniref:Uncharacterized protein n=1 Tax=Liparis tanakae TaxID=230148 RepID=A0A4Z2E396_9TELE|nr:hypothetical protein EYF80_066689 [Liparis tanakae]
MYCGYYLKAAAPHHVFRLQTPLRPHGAAQACGRGLSVPFKLKSSP